MIIQKERSTGPIDPAMEMTELQKRLSAILQSRLMSLTTKHVFAFVESSLGNGVEAWRLLTLRSDPATDANCMTHVRKIVNYKIANNNDVLSGIMTWKSLVLILEWDHKMKLGPKRKRAFFTNMLPKVFHWDYLGSNG